VYAKEEELCELQVKLGDRDTALKAYKTENSRFADMKDNFKADIAALQQQVTPYYVQPHMYDTVGTRHTWIVNIHPIHCSSCCVSQCNLSVQVYSHHLQVHPSASQELSVRACCT